jgi:hypothetical protein
VLQRIAYVWHPGLFITAALVKTQRKVCEENYWADKTDQAIVLFLQSRMLVLIFPPCIAAMFIFIAKAKLIINLKSGIYFC